MKQERLSLVRRRLKSGLPGETVLLIGPEDLKRRKVDAAMKPNRKTKNVLIPDLVDYPEDAFVVQQQIVRFGTVGICSAFLHLPASDVDYSLHNVCIKAEKQQFGMAEIAEKTDRERPTR